MGKNYIKAVKNLSVTANTTIELPAGSFLHGIYAQINSNVLVTLDGVYTIFFGSNQPSEFTIPVSIKTYKSSVATTIIYS
jgi:hypothetical protein